MSKKELVDELKKRMYELGNKTINELRKSYQPLVNSRNVDASTLVCYSLLRDGFSDDDLVMVGITLILVGLGHKDENITEQWNKFKTEGQTH